MKKRILFIAVVLFLGGTLIPSDGSTANPQDPKDPKPQEITLEPIITNTDPTQPTEPATPQEQDKPEQTTPEPPAKPDEPKPEEPKPEEPKPEVKMVDLGKILFPRAFVHAGKKYPRGVYFLTLTEKNSIPYFIVHDKKKERLFEERGVVKPPKRKRPKRKNFKYLVRRRFLKDYEYFRIRVIRPDSEVLAFFHTGEKNDTSKKTDK